jgi:hypothetical protein
MWDSTRRNYRSRRCCPDTLGMPFAGRKFLAAALMAVKTKHTGAIRKRRKQQPGSAGLSSMDERVLLRIRERAYYIWAANSGDVDRFARKQKFSTLRLLWNYNQTREGRRPRRQPGSSHQNHAGRKSKRTPPRRFTTRSGRTGSCNTLHYRPCRFGPGDCSFCDAGR